MFYVYEMTDTYINIAKLSAMYSLYFVTHAFESFKPTVDYKTSLTCREAFVRHRNVHLTSQDKIFNFATSKIKKKLTIDLLSLGIYAPGPQVSTYRPQILREVRT